MIPTIGAVARARYVTEVVVRSVAAGAIIVGLYRFAAAIATIAWSFYPGGAVPWPSLGPAGALLGLGLLLLALRRPLVRWLVPLPARGVCPACGYRLFRLKTPICPECGLGLDAGMIDQGDEASPG